MNDQETSKLLREVHARVARIDERTQALTNGREDHEIRLRHIEKKASWLTGIVAAIGAVLSFFGADAVQGPSLVTAETRRRTWSKEFAAAVFLLFLLLIAWDTWMHPKNLAGHIEMLNVPVLALVVGAFGSSRAKEIIPLLKGR